MGDQTHVRQKTFQARDVQKRLGLEYYEWRELKAGLVFQRDGQERTDLDQASAHAFRRNEIDPEP